MLAGSKLVRSWCFKPVCDQLRISFEPVCDQLRTSFEPASVMEFGFSFVLAAVDRAANEKIPVIIVLHCDVYFALKSFN